MSDIWPRVESESELDALSDRGESLHRGVAIIAQRHGWSPVPVEHLNDGSLPVFALAEGPILKLYPGMYREDFDNEARVLELIAGKLAAPTPIAIGDLEGWSYIAMTRLVGRPLSEVWGALSPANRLSLADEVGDWLRTLHSLPIEALEPSSHPSSRRWQDFIGGQQATAVDAQRQRGLGPPWLERIEPFLAEVALPPSEGNVLLHTEIMREHVFAEERQGIWRLTGVLDFEPSMPGAPEYELASVGIFLTSGDADVLRRLLLAYGYRPDELDHELQRRCMVYALLHRYTHLGWYLRRMPPGGEVDSLARLAAQWWALPGVVAG